MFNIYGIYNTINGKLYIGYSNNIKRRWQEHKKNSRNITEKSYAIHKAINKYGIENFIFKIIDDTIETVEQAKSEEIAWIKELKLLKYKLYNGTLGGEGVVGLQLFGAKNPNYGKKMKPHVKEILLKKRRKVSDEQIQEIRDLHASGKYNQMEIARMFGLSSVYHITNKSSWSAEPRIPKKQIQKLIADDAFNIRQLYSLNVFSLKELSKMFNCSVGHIKNIVHYKRWKNI